VASSAEGVRLTSKAGDQDVPKKLAQLVYVTPA